MIDPIARTISNLIRLRGGSFTMTETKPGVYDPVTSLVSQTKKTYTVKGIVFEARQSVVPNSLIHAGDKQVFIKADPLLPVPDAVYGEFVYKGVPHRIVWLKELNPSGTNPLMYELIVRA